MTTPVPPPSVPEAVRADWTQTADTTDVLFEIPGVTVTGRTRVYERDSRFMFVTRLSFEPSLPSFLYGQVESMVLTAAKDRFTDRLTDRGAATVEYDSPRSHPEAPDSVQVVPFESTHEDGQAYAGYLGVCHGETFLVAGGAYPAGTPDEPAYERALLEVFTHAG